MPDTVLGAEGSKTDKTRDPSSQRHTLERGKQTIIAAVIANPDISLTMPCSRIAIVYILVINISLSSSTSMPPWRKVLVLFALFRWKH